MTYRIGIHAQRNAGKTCLFACLYGLRAQLGEEITFDDEPTLVYLRQAWSYIQRGFVPPATAMGRPAEMAFRLLAGGNEPFDIHTADYSGALIEPTSDETTRGLNEEARAWIRSCDAILVLVDSSAPEIAQLDAVELMLAEMRRDEAPSRPLALVLTKWDTQGTPSHDPREEAERLEQYLVAHPVFARLHATLKDAAGDPRQLFAVFSLSAFGMPGPGPGLAPPLELMKPHQLGAPWAWAVLKCESLAAARQRLARRRRLMGSAMTVAAALVALAAGYRFADGRADMEFLALRDFRQEAGDDARAEERETMGARYLASWWSHTAPSQREIVRTWLIIDHERAEAHRVESARLQRQLRHDELLAAIARDATSLAERGDERRAYEMCQAFLDQFADSPRVNEVRQTQASVREKWDGRAWLDVREARDRVAETGKWPEFAVLIGDYLKVPGARNKAEAEKMQQESEWEMDRRQYDAILTRSRQGTTAETLQDVSRLADVYLNATRGRKQMSPAVQKWKEWWDTLNGPGVTVRVRLRQVAIPPESALESIWGLRPVVAVSLGSREIRSGRRYQGRQVSSDEVLGSIQYRWGDMSPLVVRVENGARSKIGFEKTFPTSAFVLTHLNDPITITDKKQKTITVILECPEAVPPGLPEYGVKE